MCSATSACTPSSLRAVIEPHWPSFRGARNASPARPIQFGKRSVGAALEDDGALAAGNVEGSCEIRPRLVLVVAVKRQQAGAAQAIDFGQIDANAGFLYAGDGTVEMGKAVGRPAGRQ